MSDLITIYHKDCLFKDNGPRHPERQERVKSVLNSIKKVSSRVSFELPSALELLHMAKEKHLSKDTVVSEQILPLYLTEESNWVKS